MKSWLFKLTGFLCAALCFASTADAGISNLPPPKVKAQKSEKKIPAKKELSKSSSKSLSSKASSSTQKNKNIVKAENRKNSEKANTSKSSSYYSSASAVKPTKRAPIHVFHTPVPTSVVHTPVAHTPVPPPVRTSLLIKKMHPTKKAKADSKGKIKRGKKGKAGKDGKRGKKGKKGTNGEKGDKGNNGDKGDKGDPGISNGIAGFVSAISVGSATSTVAVGDTIKSFHIVNNSNIIYNPGAGQFVSTAGPGNYEIHYGASWNGQCAIVLRVDGNEINPFIDLNSPTTWARESVIIHTNEASPTFALGNAKASATPMVLTSQGSYSSAFITIKKLN